MPSQKMGRHGPVFPYRFAFVEDFCVCHGKKPKDIPYGLSLCRWALTEPDRALEWNDQGKGKHVTALPSDGPERCCSTRTAQVLLQITNDKELKGLFPGPGEIYDAVLCGQGWYSATSESFFLRLVTNKNDVLLLYVEAKKYDKEPEGIRREPPRKKNEKGGEPIVFHGFFQTDAQDAAAIVFGVPDYSENDETDKKPRKKKRKAKKRPSCDKPSYDPSSSGQA